MAYKNVILYMVFLKNEKTIYSGLEEEKILNGIGGTGTTVNGIRRESVPNLT